MLDTDNVLRQHLAPTRQPDLVREIASAVARRRLIKPALLFLFSHRPLAFVTGQLLLTAQPVADLMGARVVGDIAALLSEPDGLARLEESLAANDNAPASDVD